MAKSKEVTTEKKKRKPGIPTGNAGEYAVMAELLARGFDAQLADRNTKGYDLLVGSDDSETMKKVQVKTVRVAPWFVRRADFEEPLLDRITVYVIIGDIKRTKPFRFFIAKNQELVAQVSRVKSAKEGHWEKTAFMNLKAVAAHEDQWDKFTAIGSPHA
jgi:hypothetical protein